MLGFRGQVDGHQGGGGTQEPVRAAPGFGTGGWFDDGTKCPHHTTRGTPTCAMVATTWAVTVSVMFFCLHGSSASSIWMDTEVQVRYG